MHTAPGTFAIVLQRWLPGLGVVRMNDSPLLAFTVQALFIELAVHTDKVPVLKQVLTQGIGAQIVGDHRGATVWRQVRLPQTMAVVVQADLVQAFHQRAVEQFRYDLAGHVQAANQCQVQSNGGQMT
ncbi:hypothetical protein D3C77_361420 [compost metagenome]